MFRWLFCKLFGYPLVWVDYYAHGAVKRIAWPHPDGKRYSVHVSEYRRIQLPGWTETKWGWIIPPKAKPVKKTLDEELAEMKALEDKIDNVLKFKGKK